MLTVLFDPRSNLAAIPPLSLRGAYEDEAVSRHVHAHLKPKDRKDFSISRVPGSRGGVVVLRKGKEQISFRIEGRAQTPDGHPPADPRAIVPPKWGQS
ncbi:hypothetical protein SEA_ALTADENA_51 [Arthrobacter phage Altadena]|uniref:Uncharacterized protein n=1 Tax=Arthrobacter phage Altadena TaxID=3059064 RepID=A0AA96HWF5_9CAUD|nr:hypothetical protein SEA_ALTADENA_51 [Arthrobacter phage Altadena]